MNLKKNIFNAITIILLAALIAGAVLLNNRIKKLETQMAYTSDNTSVILSDVQTMQDDIKSTLEEEASLITDWDIQLPVGIYPSRLPVTSQAPNISFAFFIQTPSFR